jgi:undecaprenyl-diphosphatase
MKAVLLGLIQGLTEFLPVSSSGHLALAESFLSGTDGGVAFAVLLHAGTLLAILLVFARGLRELVVGGLRLPLQLARPLSAWRPDSIFAAKIVIATIPGAFVGLFLEHRIEAAFGSIAAVGALLLVTATFLFATRWAPEGDRDVTWTFAVLIGCAQAIAILPGISRSGATISAAMFLGVARPRAAEFTFLAAVPLILGSLVLELPELRDSAAAGGGWHLFLGFTTSFVVGWIALRWLVRLVRSGKLHWFAPYCAAIGLVALFLSRTR